MSWRAYAAGAFLALGLSGCKGPPAEPLDASPSPQAKAEPAPLATPPSTAGTTGLAAASSDGGPAPESLRTDRALAPDTPRETARESGAKEVARELPGYDLQAVIRAGEGPGAPRATEVSVAAIDAARRRTEARVTIELSQTRARFVLSGGFVLPPGTELRSRVDRYGYVLLWPGEITYRVAEPGAIRALLGERRLDVAPLSHASAAGSGEGARRLGFSTRRVEIATRAAKATFELATLRDLGEGGGLLCRWLLDLMSAPPATAACASDEVPLHADLRWTTRGALSFDVASVSRRTDISAQDLAAPPPAASFTAAPLPAAPSDILVPRGELAALRTASVDVASSAMRDAQAPPPESGLLLVNFSDELRVAWLDGFAAAWVAPGGRAWLPSLVRGRYSLQWRTFLGDAWETPETAMVPGTSVLGKPGAAPP